MSELLPAALAYAAKGRKIFPLDGNVPRIAGGFKAATSDQAQIRDWWNRWPEAGIGTPTGREAGVWVLDIDNGGTESFYRIQEENGTIPETKSQKTGGGGYHFLFRYPTGATVPSRAGILPGIDVRGDGGYIVLPPSRHPSGGIYAWENSARIAPAPSWLLKLVTTNKTKAAPSAGTVKAGTRNSFLASLAGKLRRAGMTAAEIQAALRAVNLERCDPPLRDAEVATIAASIARYEAPEPIRCLSDVAAEKVDWLWFPRIPRKKLTIIEGDPGLGKSWLTLALATAMSRGRGLPEAEDFEPGNVLLLSAEDGPGDTIRPRLDALGGDVSKVFILNRVVTLNLIGRSFLEEQIQTVRPALLVIDPLFAYFAGDSDIHRANACREVTAGLAALAEKHDCSIVAVRHLTKGGRSKSIHRGMGSIDITAAARSVLLVGADAENSESRAVVHIKSNLAKLGNALGYAIRDGQFFWTGESDLTAEAILAPEMDQEEKTARDEAKDFLRDVLAGGPVLAAKVFKEARQSGISDRTLKRAKRDLGIKATHQGFSGPWYWSLGEIGGGPLRGQKDSNYIEDIEIDKSANGGPLRGPLREVAPFEECQETPKGAKNSTIGNLAPFDPAADYEL